MFLVAVICMFIFSLKWTKYQSTMNDSVSEFNIQYICGFRKRNELEIQILWFQILPEPLNSSLWSHLLSEGTLTVSRACFELEPKH